MSPCGWEPGTAEDLPHFAPSLCPALWSQMGCDRCQVVLRASKWGCKQHVCHCVPRVKGQLGHWLTPGARWSREMRCGHLQLLLSPLCLSVVLEACKGPSSVKHSAPCPGTEKRTNLTGAAGLDWSGKVPRASCKSCPAAEGSLFPGS